MMDIVKKNKGIIITGSLAVITVGAIIIASKQYKLKKVSESSKKVIEIAEKYLGQKEIWKSQKEQDLGFLDKNFQKKMTSIGWYVGAAWCAFFVRLVFLEVYTGKKREVIDKLLSGNTQGSYKRFKDNEDKYNWYYVSKTPKIGAIVCWQYQQKKTQGHFGIVKSVSDNGFITIEGNSNKSVRNVKRSFTEFNKTIGNKLVGFINFK